MCKVGLYECCFVVLNRIWQIELKCGIRWAQELEFPTFKMIGISSHQLCPWTSWKIGLSFNHLRAGLPDHCWLLTTVPQCWPAAGSKFSKGPEGVFRLIPSAKQRRLCVSRRFHVGAGQRVCRHFQPLRQTVDTSPWLKRAQRAKGSGGGRAVEGNDTWQRGGEIFVWRG